MLFFDYIIYVLHKKNCPAHVYMRCILVLLYLCTCAGDTQDLCLHTLWTMKNTFLERIV